MGGKQNREKMHLFRCTFFGALFAMKLGKKLPKLAKRLAARGSNANAFQAGKFCLEFIRHIHANELLDKGKSQSAKRALKQTAKSKELIRQNRQNPSRSAGPAERGHGKLSVPL